MKRFLSFLPLFLPDDELSQGNREITASDEWTELTSPYYGSDPSPLSYIRHYTVTAEEGYVITTEVDTFGACGKTLSRSCIRKTFTAEMFLN